MSNADKQQQQKQQVAEAALAWVREDSVLGIGTGSTVNCFIDALAASGLRLEAAVSSSEATTARLRALGIEVRELNTTGTLDVYVVGVSGGVPRRLTTGPGEKFGGSWSRDGPTTRGS